MSKISPARLKLLKAMPRKVCRNAHGYLTKDAEAGITMASLSHAELSGLIRMEGERWLDLWVLTDKGRAVLAKAEEADNV
jgi:hypothetical protein